MLNLKYIFLTALIATALSFTIESPVKQSSTPAKKTIRWAVQKTSTIHIEGATNINSFGCDVNNYYQPDTIYCSQEIISTKPVTLTGDLQIDISKFDCHNKMLTRDLRSTLKAREYPTLVIRFLSLERAPAINNTKDFLKGWVEIELAGNKRRFEVNYSFIVEANSLIQLNGTRSFSFSDFNLTPPKKFAGLVKVKDKLNVDFNLLLDPIK
ncbi:MAG: YceI family protein [Ferruginibacter sp.]